ncbi:hypothetical protein AB0H76_15050 [Nocardia sp. NPDC050712]|uniref:hypothetical protein n=1 Tax=Nocardia sp. NPDC050712 TaxID=3155518 RepID=UPI0033DD5906
MTTTIYYEVDGQPVPASLCMWVLIAPCGCECAWALTEYTATEDQAWEDFSRPTAVRRRDEQLGYRMTVKRRSDVQMADCTTHTPKWGVEPRPKLDGHTWAAKRGGRGLHLVPLVIEKNGYVINDDRVAAVCGRADAYSWSVQPAAVEGQVDCKSCIGRAKRLADGAVTA